MSGIRSARAHAGQQRPSMSNRDLKAAVAGGFLFVYNLPEVRADVL
jgi:hypothetical protein